VVTIAGYNLVAQQWIDQGGAPNMDEIILRDLAADTAKKLDVQVIKGAVASGELQGIINVTSPNTVTYTDASPAVVARASCSRRSSTPWARWPPTGTPPPTRFSCTRCAGRGSLRRRTRRNRPLVVPVGTDPGQAVNAVGTGV